MTSYFTGHCDHITTPNDNNNPYYTNNITASI